MQRLEQSYNKILKVNYKVVNFMPKLLFSYKLCNKVAKIRTKLLQNCESLQQSCKVYIKVNVKLSIFAVKF